MHCTAMGIPLSDSVMTAAFWPLKMGDRTHIFLVITQVRGKQVEDSWRGTIALSLPAFRCIPVSDLIAIPSRSFFPAAVQALALVQLTRFTSMLRSGSSTVLVWP